MPLKDFLPAVIDGQDLDRASATAAMESIMSGEATPAQIGAFLIAMRFKGETADEIAGFAAVMRAKATPIRATGTLIDTCGTGGDGKGTFNISTAATLIAAGAGAKVAKHGNRSVSSSSGSADVLKTLGVKIDCDVPTIEKCLEEAGVGFLFAPMLHAAMKHAIGPRREIGVRTFFNILGPLTNPAGARRQLLGVFDKAVARKLGEVLALLGTDLALVVASEDGLDEITTTAPTCIVRVEGSNVTEETLNAEDLGLPRAQIADLQVAGPDQSAAVIRGILDGTRGAHRDIAVLNAAGSILVAGLAADWKDALGKAEESVDAGKAKETLAKLVAVSNV
jgi:anthranilate phosphoribosyltransferase